jgi:hypothetical protein
VRWRTSINDDDDDDDDDNNNNNNNNNMPYISIVETGRFSTLAECAPGTRLTGRPPPSRDNTIQKHEKQPRY